MFERCCSCPSCKKYNIKHSPKPITMSPNMDKAIKELIWYVPSIESFQADENEYIKNKIYDNFAFTYVLEHMGMNENTDVKWLEPREVVSDDDWNFYENEICCNCQKIILCRKTSSTDTHRLSKLNDLLRSLRNSIAHGHFALVDDYIIGFNRQVAKDPLSKKRAVIKIKPQLLFDSINSLLSPSARELLVGYAFERVGYTVLHAKPFNGFTCDYLIEKDQRKYALEIKDYQGTRFLHPEQLRNFLANNVYPEYERVLFIDTSRVTKDVRALEKQIENFRIIDITQVKKLLADNPEDILA